MTGEYFRRLFNYGSSLKFSMFFISKYILFGKIVFRVFCSSDSMKIDKKVEIFLGSISWKQKLDLLSKIGLLQKD